jgi:site-specific DNA-methyltransferase (adenine-specific)
MKEMKIEYKGIEELIPYENNPRINEHAIDYVANSIKEFGFKNPIIIDKDNIIIAGHTRLKACEKIGIKKVPTIMVDDLTEDQIKAFRIADNKVAEFSEWDIDKLNLELDDIEIDMSDFGIKLDDDIDFIQDLLDEDFVEKNVTPEIFEASFYIPIKYRDTFSNYFKENGKEELVSLLIAKVTEGGE